LMEQGRLQEAAEAYQKMVDQKPDMQAYARISYLRWLKGDLNGAAQVMGMAVSAASPNAPETAAWVNTRLAILQAQQGDLATATETCDAALEFQKDYAPALLLQGRLLLANGKSDEAVTVLQQAELLNPLPEYQWVLSEALRAASRPEEAAAMEARLAKGGAAADPRTYALYLATRGESAGTSVQLAQNELGTREDVFTHDAVAWSLLANGQRVEAQQEMDKALSEGTKDARLYFHATVLAAKSGQADEAAKWFTKAAAMMPMLLPSEQKQLQNAALLLGQSDAPAAEQAETPFTSGN
jgi:tetratricopeptide (TPR) repeat protein